MSNYHEFEMNLICKFRSRLKGEFLSVSVNGHELPASTWANFAVALLSAIFVSGQLTSMLLPLESTELTTMTSIKSMTQG